MKRNLSKNLIFYPITLMKGEPIALMMGQYRHNQWMSDKELKSYQLERLTKLVNYAFKSSKFYRELYSKAGMNANGIRSFKDFERLPSVTKADLINSLQDMSGSRGKYFRSSKTTGGSTGQPVKIYKNPLALARERCATARAYEWANVEIGEPQLRFWGVPHSKLGKFKAGLTDLVANRKRVSAFDLTNESLQQYYNEATTFKPGYIYGYVSVIEIFARFLIENNLPPIPSLKSVITTSEILTPGSREIIAKAFGVPVFNEYGCGEVGSIAHECEHGSMHVMSDNLYLEIETDGSDAGEILVTDFFNYSTPLIRYRLGDYATLSKDACACGRCFPVIDSIHGRAYDVIELPSGKKIHPEAVIYVFEGIQSRTNAFSQFQVVQEAMKRILVRVIPNSSWNDEIKELLIANLKRDISDDVIFEVSVVSEIAREKSGKLRLVKCNI